MAPTAAPTAPAIGLSNREARWLAIEAQGLSKPRPAESARRPGPARLHGLLQQLGTIQLDAVNVVARTQFLVPFSRLGIYDRSQFTRLTAPHGRAFEYWGHVASLMPMESYPLFRWRMARERKQAWEDWGEANRAYIDAVLAEVSERGPLTAGQLSDPRRRDGEWWGRRSDGRLALEFLFTEGALAAWRSANFDRVYDVAERVIPPDLYKGPIPSKEEAQRALLVIAASALGVSTGADLADYFRISPPDTKARLAELLEEGSLVPAQVEGWRQPAYVAPDARPRRPRRSHATLLSPFDSLIWRRQRTESLFEFFYRIEIYVPAPKRTYGYYVLPMLLGDALVARFDLKADRASRTLRVHGAYAEPTIDPRSLVEPASTELATLARWLGLEGLSIGTRGTLATPLRQAVSPPRRARTR